MYPLTYRQLGELFQRLAGLPDSQEGGECCGHRLPGLQLRLGEPSQRIHRRQKACGQRASTRFGILRREYNYRAPRRRERGAGKRWMHTGKKYENDSRRLLFNTTRLVRAVPRDGMNAWSKKYLGNGPPVV